MSDDQVITFAEAAKLIPGRPHAGSVYRWADRGKLLRSGQRVFLRSRFGPKCRYTTPEWVQQFLADVHRGSTQAAGTHAGNRIDLVA
jgi:hypothetical protein